MRTSTAAYAAWHRRQAARAIAGHAVIQASLNGRRDNVTMADVEHVHSAWMSGECGEFFQDLARNASQRTALITARRLASKD